MTPAAARCILAVMTKFLVLYRSSLPASEATAGATPEQLEAGMQAWTAWAERTGEALVDLGMPLGNARRVGGSGADGGVTGFSIVQADSADAAAALLRDHPHLQMPGDAAIDVLEFLPLPGL